MRRACFTVRMKNGIGYDANHLAVTSKVSEETGMISMLSFVSSGSQFSVPASDVESVDFGISAQFCSECDGSIQDVVGAGVHANPEPM